MSTVTPPRVGAIHCVDRGMAELFEEVGRIRVVDIIRAALTGTVPTPGGDLQVILSEALPRTVDSVQAAVGAAPEPAPNTWTGLISERITQYKNGDKKVAVRLPFLFPGNRYDTVTVTIVTTTTAAPQGDDDDEDEQD